MYVQAGEQYATSIATPGCTKPQLGQGSRAIAQKIEDETGVKISHATVLRAAKRVKEGLPSAPKMGTPTLLQPEEEVVVRDHILFIRSLNLPVFKDDIQLLAYDLLLSRRPEYQNESGKMSSHWYRRFLKRNNLKSINIKGLESDRDAYFTSLNVKIHFEVLANTLLEMKYAVKNLNYNASLDPLSFIAAGKAIPKECEEIFISELGRRCLLSFDETDASLDSTKKLSTQWTIVPVGGAHLELCYHIVTLRLYKLTKTCRPRCRVLALNKDQQAYFHGRWLLCVWPCSPCPHHCRGIHASRAGVHGVSNNIHRPDNRQAKVFIARWLYKISGVQCIWSTIVAE